MLHLWLHLRAEYKARDSISAFMLLKYELKKDLTSLLAVKADFC